MEKELTHCHIFNPNVHHTCDYKPDTEIHCHIHDFDTTIPNEPNQIENHYNSNLDNIEKILSEVGIYIRKNENEYKTLPEVISETKDKWEEISKNEELKDKIVNSLTGCKSKFMFEIMMYTNEILKNTQEKTLEQASMVQNYIKQRIEEQTKEHDELVELN